MIKTIHKVASLSFFYTNQHGKRELRNVTYLETRWGENDIYPTPQLFLHCIDHTRSQDRQPVERAFAVELIEDLQHEWRQL